MAATRGLAVATLGALLLVGGWAADETPEPAPATSGMTTASASLAPRVTPSEIPNRTRTALPAATASTAPVVLPPTPKPTKTVAGTAQPVVTSAVATDAGIEVAGYVAGIISPGGECRFAVAFGGRTWTASSTAVADATHTACPSVTVTGPPATATGVTATLTWVPTGDTSEPLAVSP